jgi:hypothetical protein
MSVGECYTSRNLDIEKPIIPDLTISRGPAIRTRDDL